MAGAYCNYCGFRCFVYRIVPDGPSKGWGGHMATCPSGMALDLEKLGHTHKTAINPDRLAAVLDELRSVLLEGGQDAQTVRRRAIGIITRSVGLEPHAPTTPSVHTATPKGALDA